MLHTPHEEIFLQQFYEQRPVLVTGGAGFIGSHLVDQLLFLGARVTVLDNLSTGCVANNAQHRNLRFIEGDIRSFTDCLHAVQGQSVIFHLAAVTSVPGSFRDPQDCFATNVTGTAHLLEAARVAHVERFLFSSSSAVYGNYATAVSETDHCAPQSPYGTSKFAAELLCRSYTSLGLMTASLRYFNVYGPRQRADIPEAAFVPRIRAALAQNLPITIHGDGTQQRDFVPVTTVVSANLLLGASKPAALDGGAYNIGTGTSISLRALIDQLRTEYPTYTLPVTYGPARPGDVPYSAALCEKYEQARKDLVS